MKNTLFRILSVTTLLTLAACSSGPETVDEAENAPAPSTDQASANAATDQAPAPEPTVAAEQTAQASAPAEAPQPTGLEDEAAKKADEAALAQVTVPTPEETTAQSVASADAQPLAPPTDPADGNTPPAAAPVAPKPVAQSAAPSEGSSTYNVQRGDTLMKIAFETYGDLFQWRKIYDQNRGRIKDPNNLEPGISLTLDSAARPVSVERNGDKYLIKQGDTLGTISNDVYGTPKKWKKVWNNNKQLIRDPNRIFAGFYLYYTQTPEERQNTDRLREQTGTPGPLTQAPSQDSGNRAPASAAPAEASIPVTPPPAQGLPGGGPWLQAPAK